mmetsp:Transcript_78318/g.123655  ORF Transcript_78318/g.123655 Transcript_78318/m.123655 type:complete len:236 (+) Transcript_78318:464-1171(+)
MRREVSFANEIAGFKSSMLSTSFGNSCTLGAFSVRRSSTPDLFVTRAASIRKARSTASSEDSRSVQSLLSRERDPCSTILSTRRRTSDSKLKDIDSGASCINLPAMVRALADIVEESSSLVSLTPQCFPGAASIKGTMIGKTSSSRKSATPFGLNTSKFTNALSKRAVALTTGKRPPRPCKAAIGPCPEDSSLRAATIGFTHLSCTASMKLSPKRNKFVIVPAARPQSRQSNARK